jgi:hypothetical protein
MCCAGRRAMGGTSHGKERKGGLELVGQRIDQAKPAAAVGRAVARPRRSEEPELPLLQPGCPVEPLGKLGQIHFYLDEQKQFIALDPQKHGKTHILALFGRRHKLCHSLLAALFGQDRRLDGKPIITGWKPEVAAEILMGACAFSRDLRAAGQGSRHRRAPRRRRRARAPLRRQDLHHRRSTPAIRIRA